MNLSFLDFHKGFQSHPYIQIFNKLRNLSKDKLRWLDNVFPPLFMFLCFIHTHKQTHPPIPPPHTRRTWPIGFEVSGLGWRLAIKPKWVQVDSLKILQLSFWWSQVFSFFKFVTLPRWLSYRNQFSQIWLYKIWKEKTNIN